MPKSNKKAKRVNFDRVAQYMTPLDHQTLQQAFLDAYVDWPVVLKACRAVKISRTLFDYWMDRDPEFPHKFAKTRKLGVERLESEAVRRAVRGTKKQKFHQGRPVYDLVNPEDDPNDPKAKRRRVYEIEYSDQLLMFLLKGAAPEKYRERFELTFDGDVSRLTDQQFEQLCMSMAERICGGDMELMESLQSRIKGVRALAAGAIDVESQDVNESESTPAAPSAPSTPDDTAETSAAEGPEEG